MEPTDYRNRLLNFFTTLTSSLRTEACGIWLVWLSEDKATTDEMHLTSADEVKNFTSSKQYAH